MTRLVFRPIESWPGTLTAERDYSPFSADWRDTLDLLDRELHFLGVRDEAVVQVALPERSFRASGEIRGDAREPDHPGVILSFESKLGPLRYWTDRFTARGYTGTGPKASWKHNLRAVAKGLESLRTVERYGIAERGEQYAGWKQLGAGTPLGPPQPMTRDEAARILLVGADMPTSALAEVLTDPDFVAIAYRIAAKRNHPDTGGSADVFRKISEARDVLLGQQKAGT